MKIDDYHIYIPTRGRVDKQLTVEKLPEWMHENITLVCPKSEVKSLKANYPTVRVVPQPDSITTLVAKRKWIAQIASMHNGRGDGNVEEPFWFQMDDDLKFYVWTGEKHTALQHDEKATKKFFTRTLVTLVNSYQSVGFGTKGFALPGGLRVNYHLGFVFGFSKELGREVKWDRVRLYEDVDYTLQVLKTGHEIAITYDMTVEQRKSDAPGGLTGERNSDLIDAEREKLIALHPGIITKKPPSGQHEMSNIKVSWAKAAAMGKIKDTKSIF